MPRPIKEAIAFFYFDIGFWSDDKITDLVFDFGVISELGQIKNFGYINVFLDDGGNILYDGEW